MTGCAILGYDEEMDDLSKSHSRPAWGGPIVDAFLCLPQHPFDARRINLLSVQEDLSVQSDAGQAMILRTDC